MAKHKQEARFTMVKQFILTTILSSLFFQTAACSTSHRSTTVVERSSNTAYPATETERSTTYEVSTNNNVDSTTTPQNESVLGATFDVLGEIISWPFRAVGALFRAIF